MLGDNNSARRDFVVLARHPWLFLSQTRTHASV